MPPVGGWVEVLTVESQYMTMVVDRAGLVGMQEASSLRHGDLFLRIQVALCVPNRQRTLTRSKLPTELRCRNFVDKHELILQIDAKRAKTCVQCAYIHSNFYFRCWLGSSCLQQDRSTGDGYGKCEKARFGSQWG